MRCIPGMVPDGLRSNDWFLLLSAGEISFHEHIWVISQMIYCLRIVWFKESCVTSPNLFLQDWCEDKTVLLLLLNTLHDFGGWLDDSFASCGTAEAQGWWDSPKWPCPHAWYSALTTIWGLSWSRLPGISVLLHAPRAHGCLYTVKGNPRGEDELQIS